MDDMTTHGMLEIRDRKAVRVLGVESVLGFGDDYVALETSLGRLVIEGEKMKIENLSKENGAIEIVGKINGIAYSEPKVRIGFFSRFVTK